MYEEVTGQQPNWREGKNPGKKTVTKK
jgi:hypothetical protein